MAGLQSLNCLRLRVLGSASKHVGHTYPPWTFAFLTGANNISTSWEWADSCCHWRLFAYSEFRFTITLIFKGKIYDKSLSKNPARWLKNTISHCTSSLFSDKSWLFKQEEEVWLPTFCGTCLIFLKLTKQWESNSCGFSLFMRPWERQIANTKGQSWGIFTRVQLV